MREQKVLGNISVEYKMEFPGGAVQTVASMGSVSNDVTLDMVACAILTAARKMNKDPMKVGKRALKRIGELESKISEEIRFGSKGKRGGSDD